MVKKTLFTLLLLGLIGCEERFDVYSQGKEHKNEIKCIRYDIGEKLDKELIQKTLLLSDEPKCAYSIQLIKYHVKSCNNPQVKSLGGDFDGYIRIEILKNDEVIYKAQSDFKSDEIGAMKRVLRTMKEELK